MTSLKESTVLIVDDEPDIRELLVEEIRPFVRKVLAAANTDEGFQIYKRENVHLIISDFRMPGGTGLDLLKSIQLKGGTQPKVIFCTGLPSELSKEEAKAIKNFTVIGKPFEMDTLIKMLNDVMETTG